MRFSKYLGLNLSQKFSPLLAESIENYLKLRTVRGVYWELRLGAKFELRLRNNNFVRLYAQP